ncbi:MAG TPA: hypothetical protein VK083_03625 [Nocardia sp.]|uniref:hypothetical protein n=1 Tax=Nocardia TaxID=1817 RepID=UPI0024547A22|nr:MULTISPECIES: hypothetical protein [Nocardia]HLS75868.1 hypothetical protein [Nocardia sp.]
MLALGWLDPSSPTAEWDSAQVRRLARQLGYTLRWADSGSMNGLVDQAMSSGADVVLLPSTGHLDEATLQRIIAFVDIECAAPRTSINRWSAMDATTRR